MRITISLLVLLAIHFPHHFSAPPVSFADLAAGRAAIVDDPAYFDHLQPMEMEAKTGQPLPAATLADQRAECRRRYQAAVREFTAEEKAAIRSVVALIDPAVRKNYPQFAETPWNFLKVASNIEAGFPHTRGKHIVLRRERLPLAARPTGPAGADGACRWTRWNCSCTSRCTSSSGRTRNSSIRSTWANGASSGPSRLPPALGSSSINCSTPMRSIARGSFPSCVPTARNTSGRFARSLDGPGPKRMQAEFSMLAFYVTPDGDGFRVQQSADGRPKYSELLSVRAYREVFPQSTNIYHPHEAAADLFAKLVLFDSYSSARMDAAQRAEKEKSFGPLRDWFRKNFGVR